MMLRAPQRALRPAEALRPATMGVGAKPGRYPIRTISQQSIHGLCQPSSSPVAYKQRRVEAQFQKDGQQAEREEAASVTSSAEPTVEEIMQPAPITLRPEMTCKDAAQVLLNNEISCAPVVDGSGRLLGVLSESDLLWKSAGPLDHTIIPPVFVGAFDLLISLRDSKAIENEVEKILAHSVGQAMTKEAATITPNATLSQAAKKLLQAKVHVLPVIDSQNFVVGVITQHDILKGMVAHQMPLL